MALSLLPPRSWEPREEEKTLRARIAACPERKAKKGLQRASMVHAGIPFSPVPPVAPGTSSTPSPSGLDEAQDTLARISKGLMMVRQIAFSARGPKRAKARQGAEGDAERGRGGTVTDEG